MSEYLIQHFGLNLQARRRLVVVPQNLKSAIRNINERIDSIAVCAIWHRMPCAS